MKLVGLFVLAQMIALTSIPLAPTLAVAQGVFDDAAFCAAAKDIAQKVNKESPMMVDHLTRQDGMAVLCVTRTVDFKKTLLVKQSEFREGWLERKQQQWNQMYCDDPTIRPAIRAGWTVQMSMTFLSGERHQIAAKCG